MSKRTHKLLMILLSLALAVSPLRVTWAIPMTAATDGDSHCAQMQQDNNSADSTMAMDDGNTGSGHPCNDNCNDSCCDEACTSCTPAAPAVSNSSPATPGAYKTFPNTISSDVFPERTVIPPLRPPARLHG